jgi:hypothetical protein
LLKNSISSVQRDSAHVAGREQVEKIQNALPVKILDHIRPRRCWLDAIAGFIVNRIAQRSIGKIFRMQ